MSYLKICDHCKQVLTTKDIVSVDFWEDNQYAKADYHIDCFNFKYSCDIRKIKEK